MLGLWDLQQQRWWRQALEHICIDPNKISTPLPSMSFIGSVMAEAGKYLNLLPGIPLAVGTLDHYLLGLLEFALTFGNVEQCRKVLT